MHLPSLLPFLLVGLGSSLAAARTETPVTFHVKGKDGNGNDDEYYKNPRPSEDPWYTGPEGWEATAPGTVLRTREHAYKGRPGVKNYVDVFQLLYRTTDSLNRPLFAVTTVFIPESHAPCLNMSAAAAADNKTCSHALLSYHIPYDSACVDASISYGLQKGEPYGEIALALARGWFVSVPRLRGPARSLRYARPLCCAFVGVASCSAAGIGDAK